MSDKICDDCGLVITPPGELHPLAKMVGTGYSLIKDGDTEKVVCYQCCGVRDTKWMRDHDKTTLYLTGSFVKNWPGSLEFKVRYIKTSRHNIARIRYSVWFDGPDGVSWYGVQFGNNTQILHCRKLKRKSKWS